MHWSVNRYQRIKLSASGQEIGGDILFKRRVGFSGTPSALLPRELGETQYEKGADGLMVGHSHDIGRSWSNGGTNPICWMGGYLTAYGDDRSSVHQL